MKKILAILLALTMVLALAVPTFADTVETVETSIFNLKKTTADNNKDKTVEDGVATATYFDNCRLMTKGVDPEIWNAFITAINTENAYIKVTYTYTDPANDKGFVRSIGFFGGDSNSATPTQAKYQVDPKKTSDDSVEVDGGKAVYFNCAELVEAATAAGVFNESFNWLHFGVEGTTNGGKNVPEVTKFEVVTITEKDIEDDETVVEEAENSSGYISTGDETHMIIINGAVITTAHEFVDGICVYCRHVDTTADDEVIVEIVDPVEPSTEEEEDETVPAEPSEEPEEDTNPETGLALALVPMMIAAAVAVITKK